MTATLVSTTESAVLMRVAGGGAGMAYTVAMRISTTHGKVVEEVLAVEVSDDSN